MMIQMEKPNHIEPVKRRMETMRDAMLRGGASYCETVRAVREEYGAELAEAKERQAEAMVTYEARFEAEGRALEKVGYVIAGVGVLVVVGLIAVGWVMFA